MLGSEETNKSKEQDSERHSHVSKKVVPPESGEILSTKYYHRFIIEIESSWVEQIQLRVKGVL